MPSQEFDQQSISFKKPDEGPFFCSLCAVTKGRYEERIKCPECARLVCKDCFENLNIVGLIQCPYCSSPLSLDGASLKKSIIIEVIKLASRKFELGDYLTAEAYFQQALRIDSNSITAWKKLGELYFQQKNWEKAVYCLSKVLKMNPKDNEAKKMYVEADYRHRSYF